MSTKVREHYLWLARVLFALCVPGAAMGQVAFPENRVMQATASCDAKYIYFRVNFERPFDGLIYTERAFPTCVYANGTATGAQLIYDIRVPLRDCHTRRRTNGDYENMLIIQDNVRFLSADDRKYLLTCVPSPLGGGVGGTGDATSFTVNFGGVTVASELSQPAEVITATGRPVDSLSAGVTHAVKVVQGSGPQGAPLAGPINVGEPITYVVRLRGLADGRDARIGRCWADDGISDIQLADEHGCSLQSTGNVWQHFARLPQSDGTVTLYNVIRAWAFPTSQRVNIYCNLHMCPGRCPPPNCRNSGNARGRRTLGDPFALRPLGQYAEHSEQSTATIKSGFEVAGVLPVTAALRAGQQRQRQIAALVTGSSLDQPQSFTSASTGESTPSTHICLDRSYVMFAIAAFLLVVGLVAFIVVLSACTTGNKCFRRSSDDRKVIVS